MNRKMYTYLLGVVLKVEALFMIPSAFISLFYHEQQSFFAFFVTILLALAIAIPLTRHEPTNKLIYMKEGLCIAALAWILISLVGAVPFVLSNAIPSYLDSLFETVSGFTTTGASILNDVESLPRGMLFWRSFTHWIGGMGVLVFLLAVVPFSGGSMLHIMRAESPGPSTNKFVPKVKQTAKILYGIYIILTVAEVILLLLGGMPLLDSLINSFGTAGTGGFAMKNQSIAAYHNAYFEYVIGIFMILFGINFNIYFLLLTKKFKESFHNEEIKVYLSVIGAAVLLITLNIYRTNYQTISEAFRNAFFQVSSIITTTGFATANYDKWPQFSRVILLSLMFCGACAGSTGGGMKVSRLIIAFKTAKRELKRMLHPKVVDSVRMDGKAIDNETISLVNVYIILYIAILALSVLLISLEGFNFDTTFSSVVACINNIGPGLGIVGPIGNYSGFSPLGKIVLILDMLIGRLEIFPILTLVSLVARKRVHNRTVGPSFYE
ncbi:MAG: TrkH family potassium uptake protein [Oscillospiraceae bacterium]|jgi:trk system potassium uptake protein